jgi:hypothetical protein
MTKKDYEVLATVIRGMRPTPEQNLTGNAAACWNMVTRRLATAMLADNPKFEVGKFYAAVGYPCVVDSVPLPGFKRSKE